MLNSLIAAAALAATALPVNSGADLFKTETVDGYREITIVCMGQIVILNGVAKFSDLKEVGEVLDNKRFRESCETLVFAGNVNLLLPKLPAPEVLIDGDLQPVKDFFTSEKACVSHATGVHKLLMTSIPPLPTRAIGAKVFVLIGCYKAKEQILNEKSRELFSNSKESQG